MTPGRISQVIPTVVGQKYNVKFRYTANPESSDPAPTMVVKVNGVPGRRRRSATRRPAACRRLPHVIVWKDGTVAFTATTATTTLTFASTDGPGMRVRRRPRRRHGHPGPRRRRRRSRRRRHAVPYQAAPGRDTHILGVLGTTFRRHVPRAVPDIRRPATTTATCLAEISIVEDGDDPHRRPGHDGRDRSRRHRRDDPAWSERPDHYVAAQVIDRPAPSNVGPCILVTEPNDTWTNATSSAANDGTTGYLDDYGRSRWYKFPVQPGGKVKVTFSGPAAATCRRTSTSSCTPTSRRRRRPRAPRPWPS